VTERDNSQERAPSTSVAMNTGALFVPTPKRQEWVGEP
jgi:hypothetical protein